MDVKGFIHNLLFVTSFWQLMGRMGTLEESGQACLYLAAEATFTTGIDLLLSGGAELTYGKKTQVESA